MALKRPAGKCQGPATEVQNVPHARLRKCARASIIACLAGVLMSLAERNSLNALIPAKAGIHFLDTFSFRGLIQWNHGFAGTTAFGAFKMRPVPWPAAS